MNRRAYVWRERQTARVFCTLAIVYPSFGGNDDKTSLTNSIYVLDMCERWGAGVETQKNVRGEIGGWGRVPFNEPYAPSLSTIYDGA